MDIETRVRQAIAAGEVLKITYEGGSQPGSVREIAPMTIESGKVRAHCYMSGAVKQFSLAKITIVEGDAHWLRTQSTCITHGENW